MRKTGRLPGALLLLLLRALVVVPANAEASSNDAELEGLASAIAECDGLALEELRLICYLALLFPGLDPAANNTVVSSDAGFPAHCQGAVTEEEWSSCGNDTYKEWFCAETCSCISNWRGCGDRCMGAQSRVSPFVQGCGLLDRHARLASKVPLYLLTLCRALADTGVNQIFEQDMVPCPQRFRDGSLACVFGLCNNVGSGGTGENVCPGLRGHDRRSCEEPLPEGQPDDCDQPYLDHCSGRRPRQCYRESTQKCDGRVYDCMDLSDETDCEKDEVAEADAESFRVMPEVPDGYHQSTDLGEPLCHAKMSLPEVASHISSCGISADDHYKVLLGVDVPDELNTIGGLLPSAGPGVRLGSVMPCVPFEHLCGGRYSHDLHSCPNMERLTFSDLFCLNGTTWHGAPCEIGHGRCSGNTPWQCVNSQLLGCACPGCQSLCGDNSHLVCSGDHVDVCSNANMRMCEDGHSCAHESLFCDGYEQCPDGSDEDVDLCSRCDRGFGFCKSGSILDASFACRHRYTNRTICAIPCNGKDDLCRDMEDEKQCDSLPRILLLVFPALGVMVAVVGEEIYRFNIKPANVAMPLGGDTGAVLSKLLVKLNNHGKSTAKTSKKDKRTLFKLFKHFRKDQQLRLLLLPFQEKSTESRSRIFNLLYKFETTRHRGNSMQRDRGLKEDLGSSTLTQLFYDVVEPGVFTRLSVSFQGSRLVKPLVAISRSPGIARLKLYLGFLAMLSLYYADLAKDVFFLFLLFQLSGGQTSSFTFAVGMILLGSFVLTESANVAYFHHYMKKNKDIRQSLPWLVLLSVAFPLLPAAICINIARHSLIKHAVHQTIGQDAYATAGTKLQVLEEHHHKKVKWQQLLASTRRNENIMEHTFQFVVPTAAILLQHSSTATFSGLQRLFSQRAVPLLVLSASWSFLSMVRGAVRYEVTCKDGHMGMVGKTLLALYYLTTTSARMFAIFLYFVPATGVLGILKHWIHGRLSAARKGVGAKRLIYDVDFSQADQPRAISFQEVWEQTSDYTYYTGGASFSGYGLALLSCCVIHSLLLLFLKLKLPEAKRMGSAELGLHVLECLLHPKPLADWESPTAEEFSTAWARQKREVKTLITIFAVEHVLMCVPMWILMSSVTRRNLYLEKYFPPLPRDLEDATATIGVLAAAPPLFFFTVVPVLQYGLLMLYYRLGHPWARVFVAEMKQNGPSRSHENVANETTQV